MAKVRKIYFQCYDLWMCPCLSEFTQTQQHLSHAAPHSSQKMAPVDHEWNDRVALSVLTAGQMKRPLYSLNLGSDRNKMKHMHPYLEAGEKKWRKKLLYSVFTLFDMLSLLLLPCVRGAGSRSGACPAVVRGKQWLSFCWTTGWMRQYGRMRPA